ncbi:hypothetical protein LX36DRAFT_658148 [Colletotrichum falcatum]|nr:hypothetical protein LX36DRAFT_658148 [Colletotrichum falcatum]
MIQKDIAQIVKDLRQKDNADKRSAAIFFFGKVLHNKDRFQSAWDAIGGAAGIVGLMSEFSARDAGSMCRRLGNTAFAQQACPERHQSLDKLVRLLYDDPQDDRPLTALYQEILPACSLEVVQEWERERSVEWDESQLCRLWRCHRERHKQDFLQKLFSPDTGELKFAAHRSVFGRNLQFCDMVLSMLNTREEHTRIPSDFTSEFVMPLLRRLLRGRYDNETRDAFLDRTIQCFQRHEGLLAEEIHLQPRGLLQYTIQRWAGVQGDGKEEMKARVAKLLALLPTEKHPLSLEDIYSGIGVPRNLAPEAKYDLLQLIIRHVKGYETSLEDNSAPGLAKLRGLSANNNTWPTKLFFSIGIDNGKSLFKRLATAHPSGDFIKPLNGFHERTIMEQTQSPENATRGDAEIVKCLLMRRLDVKSRGQDWLDHARSIVEERKEKSHQSLEAKDRAFWAKSALNLCFAAGNLEMVEDTVLWARRFNNDSVTVQELYGRNTWTMQGVLDLLCAETKCEPLRATEATPASVARDIKLANKIILDLFKTMVMAAEEREFRVSQWTVVPELPSYVASMRNASKRSFYNAMESSSDEFVFGHSDILWKPALEALVEVEEITYKRSAGYAASEGLALTFLERIAPKTKPSTLADLAKFLQDRLKQRFISGNSGSQMWRIAQLVMRASNNDQPALASPFIRDLIMEGADSSLWRGKLINVDFLSSLPASEARELLHAVADAMRDKMREQNSGPILNRKGDERQPRVIESTAIRMMAQLLQNNLLIDTISSFNILTGLLAEARYIDAKVAIVDSMISTLKTRICTAVMRNCILDALAAHAVPTAAQLSEARPLSEANWIAAADDHGILPGVCEEAPLLSLMLDQANDERLSMEDKSRMSQFIVAALEKSAVHNSRWMELFLAKNGFSLEASERLPIYPARHSSLALFFKDWVSYIPASLFEVHCSVILTQIDPPPPILRITEAVKSNRDLVASNAGKHWITQFDGSKTGKLPLYVSQAVDMLIAMTEETTSNLKGINGVSIQMMQDLLLSVTEKFVRKGDKSSLYSLVFHLCHKRFETLHDWHCWRSNCAPLLKDIIAMIESIREDRKNRDWGTGAEQRTTHLQMLPDAFKIKILALPVPYTDVTLGISASSEQVDAFIAELSGLIDELANRRKPYHGDFALLKEDLMKAHKKTDSVYFAWKLGGLFDVVDVQEPTRADYLRLEVVGEFLLYADGPSDKDHLQKARKMLYALKESKAEDLRSIAFSIEDKLRGRGKLNPLKFD